MTGLRLLLDQMIDADVAAELCSNGYDVERVSDFGLSQADDAEVLAKAIREDRILVTLDEHFGDWCVLPLGRHPGVIRVKANPAVTTAILAVLKVFLQSHGDRDFSSMLVIVGANRARWIATGND